MDTIPFYYENGQLEALCSAHQWLKQSELAAGTTCSIWSSGLNEAIARERFARATTTTLVTNGGGGSGGVVSRPFAHMHMTFEIGMPTTAAATAEGISRVNQHFLRQQYQQQQQQQMQQQHQQREHQHQLRHTVKNGIVNKINRRRKAAIIARFADNGAAEGIPMSAISVAATAERTSVSTSIPTSIGAKATPLAPSSVAAGGGIVGYSHLESNKRLCHQRTTAVTTALTTTAKTEGTSASNPGVTASDGSESDEESDVEVFELDEPDLVNEELMFGKLNRPEERKHKDDDPKVAQWRESFEKAITERYQNKCRRRNMLCRRMLEFNLQRLKATESIELSQLLLTDLRIREKYAMTTEPVTGQLSLTHRESGRVFICLEEMFDVLSNFHTDHGHGGSRKAMYVEARKRFANVSKEIVREFLKGCARCAGTGGGWGGRRVKGVTGRVATTGVVIGEARTSTAHGMTPRRTTDIVGGLALRQYLERIEQQQQQKQGQE